MIERPAFKSIERVDDLGAKCGDDNYNGKPGWIFNAEREDTFCYAYEWEERGLIVVPICNEEYTFATPEEAAKSEQLLEWAIGEDMFPSFRHSICVALRTKVDEVSVELMSDRASGDIAPDQVEAIDEAVEAIGTILFRVWNSNPPKGEN
jgi:hypothetical protein